MIHREIPAVGGTLEYFYVCVLTLLTRPLYYYIDT